MDGGNMELITIFIIILLAVIAVTLVLISIKLTDLLAESKASRVSVQNIEADEFFRQSYLNQQLRIQQAGHTDQILQLLQGIDLLLSQKLKSDKPRQNQSVQPTEATSAVSRFGNSRL